MADPNAASVVQTVTWFCAALCGIAVVLRSVIKARMIRHVGADDVFIWLGYLCFIGQCVTVQFQLKYGLGTKITAGPSKLQMGELVAEYADYLVYMPVIACAKLSVVSMLRKCALNKRDRLLLYSFEWFLAAWGVSAEFVRAFACQMPTPWDYMNMSCINREAWVMYFEMVNIFTELALIIIPTLSIARMPTNWDKKLVAISFFSIRFLIIPASVARIVYYWTRINAPGNAAYNMYPFSICTVVVAALEILAACVLYARPLFEILETGFSTSPPISPTRMARPSQPAIGLYSKGTWPFTRMSTADEFFTRRGAGYEARIQAMPSFWNEKSPYLDVYAPTAAAAAAAEDQRIHISRQVDVHTFYPPVARLEQHIHFDRVRYPSTSTIGSVSVTRSLSIEKDLPPTPDIPRSSFLIT